ncbi:uncharacterized protein LOC133534044 [Cydia pomonella]|uniref:uncharacterized protein LOC133526384 n=1 Tax=Cydia pomonella TaxID=82600 RepID=UPI002ADD8DD5|nr:uncharacterized protein LOC133526384 [Cydia pomonella]XP_061729123.1 uncharacterized protein LOC133534044 [Cydia pomonella]XP_061729124.1 uncharacterized protein LOC133534044 [Cydia pomonella]
MSRQKHFCCDDETGEIITYLVNDETGEPTPSSSSVVLGPRAAVPPTEIIKFPKGYMSKTKKFQALKENIIRGSNVFSPRLLLIPLAAVFPAVLIMLLMMAEVFIHVCCHKQNKSLKDTSLYYRSPLHMVTSIFCGMCREDEMSSKIGQLQDQRRCRYGYFQGITI